jgi:hypothetical protein
METPRSKRVMGGSDHGMDGGDLENRKIGGIRGLTE